MARVSYIVLPPGYEDLYKSKIQPGDRFTFSRVRVKDIFLSRARVKGLSIRSQLVTLAPVWQALSVGEKDAWTAAGEACGLTGWKMFVVDTTERRKAGFSGYATPNTLYQSEVGRIFVESPATGLLIEQAHPLTYFVKRKVTGTRSQYSPVAISESFSLPLEISCSYKTDLTALGSDARARFFCVVYSSYQGTTREATVALDFGLSDDWQRVTATISSVVGPIQGYSAFFEVYNARGDLFFDNVSIKHGGENWARDPACNNVSQNFTRAFYQVAKHWVAVNPSEGADFGSFYFT